MPGRQSDRRRRTPDLPPFQAGEERYDEPPLTPAPDRMPRGTFRPGKQPARSDAELRIQVEQLLERREAPPAEAWRALGENAFALLERMLDDGSLREALRQRVIATLGQIGAPGSIPRLGAILTSPAESALNRAYAASALGQAQDARALPYLGRAIADRDTLVRRQVTRALGQLDLPGALPYLDALQQDASPQIARLAAEEMRRLSQPRRAATARRAAAGRRSARPRAPHPDEE